MIRCCCAALLGLAVIPLVGAAERINHAGRVLPPVPPVTTPLLFNTTEADAVMAALQLMPRDHACNEDISGRPLLANSDEMIAAISGDLAASRQSLRAFQEMNWVLVPPDQPLVQMHLFNWPGESDDVVDMGAGIAEYPIPTTTPIEGWPSMTGDLSLDEWQRDVEDRGGDRHAIVLRPSDGAFWETWLTRLDPDADPEWQASNLARWNLGSRALRPDGWTSGDAAGLPMLPFVVRYDEVQRGEVEHALRMIVRRTRKAYVYPASHHASPDNITDPDWPRMGERLRLKADVTIPAGWSHESKVVAAALKRYGGIVADNGGFLSFSVAPDDRWSDGAFDDLRDLTVDDFEVVQPTAEDGGPRSPGAPTADAGVDRSVTLGDGVVLTGTVGGSGITVAWSLAPHVGQPGGADFASPGTATTGVSFDSAGIYTLLLAVSDGVHVPAYDALRVTVVDPSGAAPSVVDGRVVITGRVPAGTVTVRVDGAPAALVGDTFTATVADDAGEVVIEAEAADGRTSRRRIAVDASGAGDG